MDRLTLVEMHGEASPVSLEQRRHVQLVGLKYIYKKFGNVEPIFARNTRQARCFNFRTDNYQSSKYMNSLYFKGTILWEGLGNNVMNLQTVT